MDAPYPPMYHILNCLAPGSYHTPSLNTIAVGYRSCSQGLSGRSTGFFV